MYAPRIDDCWAGMRDNIDPTRKYQDEHVFSYGTCFMVYRTDGAIDFPLSGQVINDTLTRMLKECCCDARGYNHRGSFGTGNCDQCHVTVDYQDP